MQYKSKRPTQLKLSHCIQLELGALKTAFTVVSVTKVDVCETQETLQTLCLGSLVTREAYDFQPTTVFLVSWTSASDAQITS